MNQVELAHGIWTGNLPRNIAPFYKLGINGLESGVCNKKDTLIYQATGCFLHACNPDLEAAKLAVNDIMGRVVDESVSEMKEQAEPLLGHWKYCLQRIYHDDSAPATLFDQLNQKAEELKLSIPEPGKLAMIKPSPWGSSTKIAAHIVPREAGI
jgi:hypothetical protein